MDLISLSVFMTLALGQTELGTELLGTAPATVSQDRHRSCTAPACPPHVSILAVLYSHVDALQECMSMNTRVQTHCAWSEHEGANTLCVECAGHILQPVHELDTGGGFHNEAFRHCVAAEL